VTRVLIAHCAFEAPITDEAFAALCERLRPCMEIRFVTGRETYLEEDRTRAMLVFEAADAETVRNGFRSANVGFERVSGAWRR
jgi:hypothetical protein